MDGGLDALAVISVLLGLENLSENRQQSAQQEKILNELNVKFDRIEQMVKGLKENGTIPTRNNDDGRL